MHSHGAGGNVTGLFHVGLTVGNMDEALRFYRDALGLEQESIGERPGDAVAPVIGIEPERLIVAWLRVPGSDARLELFEYQGIERFSAAARPCDIGYGHFCLYVDDLDAVYARLRAGGYGASPDGYNVELYQPATAT